MQVERPPSVTGFIGGLDDRLTNQERLAADTGWIEPAYLNSWTAIGAPNPNPSYRRVGNRVFFEGAFSHSGASQKEAFALPAAFRPKGQAVLTGAAGTLTTPAPCWVIVTTAGGVSIAYAGIPELLAIDGLSFTVD